MTEIFGGGIGSEKCERAKLMDIYYLPIRWKKTMFSIFIRLTNIIALEKIYKHGNVYFICISRPTHENHNIIFHPKNQKTTTAQRSEMKL